MYNSSQGVILLRCSSVRKHLSALLDDELDSRKRRQIELHISECAGCQRETGELQEIISHIRSSERPEAPPQIWEEVRRRLNAVPERSSARIRWKLVPAGAVAFALLLYFLGSHLFIYKLETGRMPIDVYLQEHALFNSEQVLPPDLLSDLTVVQAAGVEESGTGSKSTSSTKPVSELEMLMEVHYGGDPTNGI